MVSSERPASFIKEKVISTIAERCRDATLRDVFKASTKKRVKDVCDCLMDSSPLYPRVLSEILNACSSMVARSLVDKFSSATSILKLISSMAGYDRAERRWKRATYLVSSNYVRTSYYLLTTYLEYRWPVALPLNDRITNSHLY